MSRNFMSILTGDAGAYRMSLRDRFRAIEDQTLTGAREWWGRQTLDPARRKKTMRRLSVAGAVLLLALVGGAWALWGPRFQPDYETAGIDDVFDYTLLSDEFNNLPVEERMKLLGQLIKRMKGMSSEDSMLLAAFASGIGGAARKQIEENASRMAIDVWDKHAKKYGSVPPDQREEFLEDALVDYIRTIETVTGMPSEKPDEQIIKEAREQTKRDVDWAQKNPERMPDGKTMGRAFGIINNNVGGHAAPEQKQRGQQMMRDMMRHLRGQDIATGKPLPPAP